MSALFDRSGKPNIGDALETAVLHELKRRNAEVAYVRTPAGFEVDFYARTAPGEELLIQVCATLDDPATLAREVRALQDAAVLYPKAKRILIALDLPAAQASVDGLAIVRASDWLLGAG